MTPAAWRECRHGRLCACVPAERPVKAVLAHRTELLSLVQASPRLPEEKGRCPGWFVSAVRPAACGQKGLLWVPLCTRRPALSVSCSICLRLSHPALGSGSLRASRIDRGLVTIVTAACGHQGPGHRSTGPPAVHTESLPDALGLQTGCHLRSGETAGRGQRRVGTARCLIRTGTVT